MQAQEVSSDVRIRLEESWKRVLLPEFSKPYMTNLRAFLQKEISAGKVIYPKPNEYFAALDATPLHNVKVVILGQDPYHGPGQAHGLCFSVRPGVPPPPSLVNIFKELRTDCGIGTPKHGCLKSWAEQGVLLLNSVLSVEQGRAAAHQNQGWETFTDAVIAKLNAESEHLVFILWGAYAFKKGAQVDRTRHLVLAGPHPSPLSAHRGFFGSRPFSTANAYLQQHDKTPIDWKLPDL